MTEREIITEQQNSGVRYLMQVGMFIHAYEGAAFAVARVTGYKIRLVHRKGGDIRMLGFGAAQLEGVSRQMADQGMPLQQVDERLWTFEGGDDSEDGLLVSKPSAPAEPQGGDNMAHPAEGVLRELLDYNLAASTPMEAMLFLSDLQRRYGKK